MENPIFRSKYETLKYQISSLQTHGISYIDEYESIILDGLKDLLENPYKIDIGFDEVTIDDGMSSRDWFVFQQNMFALSGTIDQALFEVGESLNKTIIKCLAQVNTVNDLLNKQIARADLLSNDIKQDIRSISVATETNIYGTPTDIASGNVDTQPYITFHTNRVRVDPTKIQYKVKNPDGSISAVHLNNKVITKRDSDIFDNGYFFGYLQPSDAYGATDYFATSIENAFDGSLDHKCYIEFNNILNKAITNPFSIEFQVNVPNKNSMYYITTVSDAEQETVSFNDTILVKTNKNSTGTTSNSNMRSNVYPALLTDGVVSVKLETKKSCIFDSTRLAIKNQTGLTKLNLIESIIFSTVRTFATPLTGSVYKYLDGLVSNVNKFMYDVKKDIMYGIPIQSVVPYYTRTEKYSLTIPEILFEVVTFTSATTNEYVSKTYEVDTFKSIEIESDDYQPTNDIESVRYSISVDTEPGKWYDIRPTNWSINKYNENMRSRIEFETSPTKVNVRILLQKEATTTDVPRVYSYNVRIKH